MLMARHALVDRVNPMAHETVPIDVTSSPDLRRLAEDVASSQTPRILRRGEEDMAVVVPAPRKHSARHGRPTSQDDPLWQIIGMADAAVPADAPTDVSSHKQKYLADAYDVDRP